MSKYRIVFAYEGFRIFGKYETPHNFHLQKRVWFWWETIATSYLEEVQKLRNEIIELEQKEAKP